MGDADTSDQTHSPPSAADPDAPGSAAPDGDPPEETTRSRRRRPTAGRRLPILPWVVAFAALVMAGISTWQWLSLENEQRAREEVQRAAETFIVGLTNWDATDGLEDTRTRLEELGAGSFVDEVDELFGGTLGAELEAAGAVSRGEVQDVFVQRIEGDQAVVFAVAVQELSTDLSDAAERTVRSARLELTRVEGAWRVSSVQLLADGGAVPDEAVSEEPATEEPATDGATDAPVEETSP
jgi:hypothetical protein